MTGEERQLSLLTLCFCGVTRSVTRSQIPVQQEQITSSFASSMEIIQMQRYSQKISIHPSPDVKSIVNAR